MYSIFVCIAGIFISGALAEDDQLVDGIIASQSSTSDGNEAVRAIDGNTDTDLRRGYCSLTEAESFNWWMLDLSGRFSVTTVRIYNRADCCRMDLKLAVIHISSDANFETSTQCDTPYSESDVYMGPMIDKTCAGVTGGYVRISSSVSPIQLCEVQVFGSELDTCSLGNDCDNTNGICINNGTEYACGCNSGYYLQSDGLSCIADACSSPSLNECDPVAGVCSNNGTAYYCECKPNYLLQDDERTCVADPCSNSTLNSCDEKYGACTSNGTEYTCACQGSYILQPDGVTCSDFDICANSTLSHCDEVRGFCVNNGTGYYCGCNPPYHIHSDGLQCIALPQSKTFELVTGDDACLRGELREFISRSLLRCGNACLSATSCAGYHFHPDAGGTCVFERGSSDKEVEDEVDTCFESGKTYAIRSS